MKELSELDIARIVDDIPSSNLVLYCPGLQGRSATLIDRSQSANHGTISGAAWKRLPRGLLVLKFDGNDNVACGTSSTLNFTTQDFAIEEWVNPRVDTANYYALFCRGATNVDGYEFITEAGGYLEFNTNQAAAKQQSFTAAGTLSIGVWQHLVVTRIGAAVKFYKNGSLVSYTGGSAAAHVDPLTSVKNARIGENNGLIWDFDGMMGLWRVYSPTIPTAVEIAGHYQRERHLFGV